jgi:hypothetical protein
MCGAIINRDSQGRRRGEDLTAMNDNPSDAEQEAIRVELERLRLEHKDLEAAIDALITVGAPDQLQIQRLKKRKLILRDRISLLEDQLTPDIIA